ncbi:MAG: protocatechuate 3,4-dioxygenase subunit alpha [Casimicrobiaceae bacterium]
MSLLTTSSQTVGPFGSIGFAWLTTTDIAPADVAGERVTVEGCIVDGDGKPVSDAMLEIWQANTQGKYAHPDDRQDKPVAAGFRGFGRFPTDARGAFRFTTIKPGNVPGPGATTQAPHLLVSIFMRGLLKRLVSRIYFPDDPANATDAVLALVPADRRATLIAKQASANASTLTWNVILQGADETVFFDC